MKNKSEYKSEGDSSEVRGQGVGLTDCWLQLVCCAVLVVMMVQFTGRPQRQVETRGKRAKGKGQGGESTRGQGGKNSEWEATRYSSC
jgi:membrane protein implicated in regulation of membrane protease activity